MSKQYIIALDQGTTSSRAVLFDQEQNIISICQKEFMQYYPQAGWVEHDPMELWSSQYGVLQELLAKNNLAPDSIAAIGISNQRETTIVWDKNTGNPIYNAIVWQCKRTASICEELKAAGLEAYVKENTGLVIDAYFSATKLKWILEHVQGAKEKAEAGELLFGTVDSWLVWKLTGGKAHVTDYTNAARTMLYNIKELRWDTKLLQALAIPAGMLPKVCNSSEIYGYADLGRGFAPIPIAGMAGDQQAALFGQACFEKGSAKNTYGTGCFLLMNTKEEMVRSKHGLLTTIAIGLNGQVDYALEGSVFVGGAVIQWIRDELRFVNDAADTEYFAGKVENNGGVYLVPAFAGLGAPYWDMYARGAIFGLTRGTGRNHLIRAALESIAYQTKDVLDAMEADLGKRFVYLKVDGGACKNNFLMQFQSDILGSKVLRPAIIETTALGAAYLAGLAVGFWKNMDEISHKWQLEREFVPQMQQEARKEFYAGWKNAVARIRREELRN
ncbi:MAG: glycerol kinase GlpK [Clostridia bacterium]